MLIRQSKKRQALLTSLFSALFLSLILLSPSTNKVAQAAPGAISGTVYRDYNANGLRDSLEPGIEGIVVTAYGANNAVAAITATSSSGSYALSLSAGDYRLEFTPNADQVDWLKAGASQTGSGNTTVIFASEGAENVDVSFNDPSQYCDSNPDVTTTCFVFGDHSDTSTPDDGAVSIEFGTYGIENPHTNEIRIQDAGSIYGLAYQRGSDTLFSSAFLKRHSDLGPNGAGAVYMTNRATGTTTLFADLNNIEMPDGTLLSPTTAGADPRDESSIGGTYSYTYTAEYGSVETQIVSRFWYHDPDVFDKVGEWGIGDIDLSSNDEVLYIVNMMDRKLYAVDAVTTPATKLISAPVDIPNTCAVDADARPMAVKYHDGMVYVGVVCSAESTQSLAELKAEVFVFNPATQSFDTTPSVSAPMNYDRGCIWRDNLYATPQTGDCAPDNNANWRPWNNDWQQVFSNASNSGGNHFFTEYPQPLLADIEFDNGSMILGFRDLTGDRVGYCAGVPDENFPPLTSCDVDVAYAGTTNGQGIFRGNGMGDILRACGDPTNGWTLENGSTCSSTDGSGKGVGPAGSSYYWNDNGPGGPGHQLSGGAEWWAQNPGHDQTVIGGLAQIPGHEYLVTNQIDSSNVYNAGLVYFSNLDGGVTTPGATITDTVVRKDVLYSLSTDTFGKANGLGDIELFCDAAPTEVGNRVWNDANGNGIQDPDEPGISGVILQLNCNGQTTVAVTGADGSFLFSNATGGNATFMDAGEACTITVIGGVPAGSSVTQGALAINDMHDNDADSDGVITFTAGDAGENNHNLDIGYTTNSYVPPVGEGAIGNYVWLDENSDGVQDAGEPGIPNVIVKLTDTAGNTWLTTTDANGGYLFPHLPASTYTVMVLDSNMAADGPLDGYTQTPLSTGSAATADFGNKDDAGYVIVLSSLEENMTADFGYNANPTGDVNGNTGDGAIGDRVWIDLDGDGVQDPNEVGVEGVGLTLTGPGPDGLFGTPDDVTVATTTTDANGNYLFDDLEPGAYEVCVNGSSMADQDVLDAGLYAPTGDPDHFGRPASSLGSDPQGLAGDSCMTQPVVIGPGDVYLNVDFGYQPEPGTPVGSIGNTVWFDADADGNGPSIVNDDAANGAGSADNDEPAIAQVTVALIEDTDGNGIWDAGEPIVATDETDENGQYFFGGLPLEECAGGGAGVDQNYLVWVNDTNSVLLKLFGTYDDDGAADDGGSLDASSTLGLSASTINCTDSDDTDQDFGYTPTPDSANKGLVGDTVWFDIDGNGVQDADEPGIEGVVVKLTLDGRLTTTDENGRYWFSDLPLDESYTVMIDDSNFSPNGVLAGMTQTYDEDAPTTDGMSVSATLTAANPADLLQDFGYTGAVNGKLGNLVWLDLNANGTYEAAEGEATIADVTLDLYRDLDCNGLVNEDDVLFSSATTASSIDAAQYGSDGVYIFEGLPVVGNGPSGGVCYVVDVTDDDNVLAGYWHSLGAVGTSNESQADPYGNAGSGRIELTAANNSNLTADFGYYVDPGCVGNRVWVDGNSDNVQGNATDTGLGGATLTLDISYANGDTISLNTISGGDGFYEFCNLLLDEDYNDSGSGQEPNYTISAEAPAGYSPVASDQGGDDLLDSDNPAGVAANPVQGADDTDLQAPANDEPTIASYDFGYTGTPDAPVDYGDAPDSYGTTTAADGAAHMIVDTLYLGSCVDADGNGQPDAYAGTTSDGGDDNTSGAVSPSGASCTDDEDGVTDNSASWGENTNGGFEIINASADGCLNAWVDFNRDGQFLGADEHIIVNELVTSSTGLVNFDVPVGGKAEPTFARYRLTARDGGLCTNPVEATGLEDSGEVEDYYIDFGIEVDFGDLPESYGGTRASDDGASHVIIPGLKLGASVDGESDAAQHGTAEGDDNAGSDDEDGIFAAPEDWVDGSDGGSIGVVVMGEGCLNGWIDWNSDGVFTGSGEHIVVNQLVSGGNINVDFDIPDGGTAESPRFARYRLTPRDGNNGCSEAIGSTGRVVGGEVEDYQYIVNDSTAVTLSGGGVASSTNQIVIVALMVVGMLTVSLVSRRRYAQLLLVISGA